MPDSIHWLDVEEIALRLLETHPEIDPLSVRFTDLKKMVAALPGFAEKPGHPPNEKILETIQSMWYDEYTDAKADADDE